MSKRNRSGKGVINLKQKYPIGKILKRTGSKEAEGQRGTHAARPAY